MLPYFQMLLSSRCLEVVRICCFFMKNKASLFIFRGLSVPGLRLKQKQGQFLQTKDNHFGGVMADADLDSLRAKRMAEMQAEKGAGQAENAAQNQQKQEQAAAKQEEMKNAILSQVLDQNARARLSNIAAAKPEKARMLENTIINMARFGQIQGKLGDDQLKELLDRISEQTQKTTKINFRRTNLDSDED